MIGLNKMKISCFDNEPFNIHLHKHLTNILHRSTVSENDIGAPKMRNNF